MNEKEQLIKEIEQAPDFLVKEVLDFLLFTKSRAKYSKLDFNGDLATQLRKMAEDREIKAEMNAINQDFLSTEMDGLTET